MRWWSTACSCAWIWAVVYSGSSSGICALDNGLGTTPALGWSSWNYFTYDINETIALEIGEALVTTGLRDAGFTYVSAGVHFTALDSTGLTDWHPFEYHSCSESTYHSCTDHYASLPTVGCRPNRSQCPLKQPLIAIATHPHDAAHTDTIRST